MVAIMSYLHQYVPTHANCSEPTECTYKPSQEDQFYKILVGGDQLTAARARSSKKVVLLHIIDLWVHWLKILPIFLCF